MPNRDERREDEWTDLQEDLLQPIDNVVDEKTTEFPDLLDPVPRETTNNPVFEPFMPQQPQVKDYYEISILLHKGHNGWGKNKKNQWYKIQANKKK